MLTFRSMVATCLSFACITASYLVEVQERPSDTILSFVDGTSTFQQIFNPSFIEASNGTSNRRGIIARTQDCDTTIGGPCVFCGGDANKASILTFSAESDDGSFTPIDANSVVFGPHDSTDSWGTEDPRVAYNAAGEAKQRSCLAPHYHLLTVSDGLYYMFYTAYNGTAVYLSLATSPNPTSPNFWTRHGPVFPDVRLSKNFRKPRSSGVYFPCFPQNPRLFLFC